MVHSALEAGTQTDAAPSPAEIITYPRIIKEFSRNRCPKCRSENLLVKNLAGIERLMVRVTSKRKYRCKDCGSGFRMVERRLLPRESKTIPGPALPTW